MVKQLFAFLLLLVFAPLAFAEDYKVESIGALKDAAVAEAVRGAVEEKGLRVADSKGKTICDIWFRKDIPTSKADIPGASFGQIAEGTLVGVINFPANTSDFRGQGIKAGWYTLRYALILQDGNHLGVSAARDFFLICPAADDKDPNAALKMEDLLKLSRTAAGAGHPSPWYFGMATSADKDLPKIVKNEHEHVILEAKLNTKSGPLSIGLVIIGRTEG
ncbi:MAG TPA: hypothetical protein PLK30_17515 [Blastocatellia bacterium]|nr:hypothetical protein [Blastocatellia bacterium]